MRKAIGGENGRAVDAAIPDEMRFSATIIGLERLRHTMRILHVVAVMHKLRLIRLEKAFIGEGKTLYSQYKWGKNHKIAMCAPLVC
jgi:hypothetical protein